MWVLCRDDVRLITIYKGRRLVTLPSVIFYKGGASLWSLQSERARFKPKMWKSIATITAFFNKVIEIILQAESEKSDLSQASQGTESSQEETEH